MDKHSEDVVRREPAWIRTAWAWDGSDSPWLIAAYDQFTGDEWNGDPDFYAAAIAEARKDNCEVREVMLRLDFDLIRNAFKATVIDADALSGRELDRG